MIESPSQTETAPGAPVRSVAIVGAGSIGVAWAIVFASAGREVRLFEIDEARRALVLTETKSKLEGLHEANYLSEPIADVLARISTWASLPDALDGVGYVQECIVEDLDIKCKMFADLDELAGPQVVLASSSSTIVASRFAEGLAGRDRCLVVHPGNPPYFMRVAEIVPASFTAQRTIAVASTLLSESGIAPILLNDEIEGFVFNRLQGALLREAYCLVRDNIVSPLDLDTIVREGLGLRWSLMGPFATSEVNTRGGLRRHAELFGPIYARLGLERGGENPWTRETVDRVAIAIQQGLPHDSWEENVRARDRAMIQLLSRLRDFENSLLAPARIPASV